MKREKPFTGISKNTEKAIEDALSEAMSSDEKNPTSLKNTLKGRNRKRKPKPGRLSKKYNQTPDMPKDPALPRKMGTTKLFQLPYRRSISGKLGTTELPAGPPVPDRMKPPMRSQGQADNVAKKFANGGDVRFNPNRGKTY